ASSALGVSVAVRLLPSYATPDGTSVPSGWRSVNVDALTVPGPMAREKGAVPGVAFGAPSPGVVETTVGAGWLTAAVVKLHETGAAMGTPSIAAAVCATVAVYVVESASGAPGV